MVRVRENTRRGLTVHGVTLRGIAVRAKAVRPVMFVCPRCEADSPGHVVRLQRWMLLLNVPVVPLATLDPKVECDGCGYQAGLGVLDIPTADQLAEWLTAAMRSAVATVVRAGAEAGGHIADDVRSEAIDVMISAGHIYDQATLNHDVATLIEGDTEMCLRLIRDELSSHGKQGFLQRMIAISLADGELSIEEQRAIVAVGVALGMAAPHINGVLAAARARARATWLKVSPD
jgi:tellurite resistance protein